MTKILAIVTLPALLLAACTETVDRQALADAAVAQITALNEQGIDPISLDEKQLALLSAACALVPIYRPADAVDIASACEVIREAAK